MIDITKETSAIPNDDSATLEERIFLYGLIRAIKPKVAVEIGTHRGLAALWMAQALCDNHQGILHTCDPVGYDQESNFAKFPELQKRIKFYMQRGQDLDIRDVDFLFIDGYHEEEFVLAEMKRFEPRLTESAVVVFHDCGGDNVQDGIFADRQQNENLWKIQALRFQ